MGTTTLKKIASFQVNHEKLTPGIYVSRIDGDVVTYDVRMKTPNAGDYLPNAAMHTFEHLFATFARSSEFEKDVIYVGPMGCRTGFYFLLRDSVTKEQTITLLQDCFAFIASFEGDIPGVSRVECGNYLEHDLEGAKKIARDMIPVVADWTPEKMVYTL